MIPLRFIFVKSQSRRYEEIKQPAYSSIDDECGLSVEGIAVLRDMLVPSVEAMPVVFEDFIEKIITPLNGMAQCAMTLRYSTQFAF